MDLPVDPVRLSVEEILAVLLAGHRTAAATGPEAAITYLQRILQDTIDLPPAVRMVVYELLSEAQAELLDWEGCTASLARAQDERRLALETEPPRPPAPPREPQVQSRAAAADPTSASPRAVPEGLEAPRKHCRNCGKDVTHRSRRKDPVTGTYLCSECSGRPHPERSPGRPDSRRPALWIAALSLLALVVFLLLVLGTGGGP